MSDAPAYYFNAHLLAAGIGFFAFIHFLSVAVLHRTERMYGYFALACLAMALSSVFSALSVHAKTMEAVFAMMHWRATFIGLAPMLLVRVIAGYSGKPAPRFILVFTDISSLALVVFNWLIPESIFYSDVKGLETYITPWGEALNQPIAKAGSLLLLGWTTALVDLIWGSSRAIQLL